VARAGDRKGVYRVLVGNSEGKYHLEDVVVDWGITLKQICDNWDGGMDWIDVAQDRERWRAVVNAAMNLPVL